MADRMPPRLAAGERETLLALLQFQRDSLALKLADLDEAAARRELVGSGTTLLWLAKHLTGAEYRWIVDRFAGQDIEVEDALTDADTIASVLDGYRAAWARTDAIVAAASSLDEGCRRTDAVAINLRWVLMHLLEETARHAGHADILREQIDGQTGR